uniref:Uncharacterized protein n=1 Tax=Micromonas pusilla TaxID=38833 RepID=A0A7S0PUL1_MICPS
MFSSASRAPNLMHVRRCIGWNVKINHSSHLFEVNSTHHPKIFVRFLLSAKPFDFFICIQVLPIECKITCLGFLFGSRQDVIGDSYHAIIDASVVLLKNMGS